MVENGVGAVPPTDWEEAKKEMCLLLTHLSALQNYEQMTYSVMARFSTEKPMPAFTMWRPSVAYPLREISLQE